jgi:hypothetical protein
MASLPPITGPSFPEDFEQPVTLAPVDDDGVAATLDSPPTTTGTNCDINDVSGDGLSFVVTPKLAAKAGDTVTSTTTIVSEGETSTQDIALTLLAGGVANLSPSFATAVKSTRRT